MRISVDEVFETVKMTLDYHFDIRTVTLGINLKDCMDRKFGPFSRRVHKRIVEKGKLLNKFADHARSQIRHPDHQPPHRRYARGAAA